MKYIIAISLIIGVAYGASMYDTVKGLVSGATSGYGSNDDYGENNCYPTYETKYRKQCEDYTEKVCYTTHAEKCQDVGSQRCKAMKTSKQERKCHDVNELLCSLKESVQHEEIPAVFTVQKCHTVNERVCDTAYGTEMTERDDFKCIRVPNTYCALKERTVYDKTCRTMINFDCKPQEYGSFSQGSGSDGYGSSGSDGYGSSGYDSSDSSYGGSSSAPQYKCKRTPETKCYTTPRTVSSEYCEERDEEVCEKLTERVPVPQEKQVCHDEKKKVCELEQRSQPKQVKKYVYTKQCRPVPKTVCDNADQMSLIPSCVPSSRKECSYHPQERCENVPKQHCYQIPYQVKKMECTEGGNQAGGYGSQDEGSSGY